GGLAGTELEGEILDLSPLGCFVKTRNHLALHDNVKLHFRVYGFDFECPGNVVWLPLSSVTHPKGMGVKFYGLSRLQRRGLKVVEKRLRKIARFYRASRYLMSPEDFSQRMVELNSVDLKQESASPKKS
ncbi:MAG: PilZ domain-containing protein, partial [Proteobacteria bacterium]|nr:PilZ domain-containing protein [Pseudomonadota bacterium]